MKSLPPAAVNDLTTEPDTVVLDLRTSVEYEDKRLPDSLHIPVDDLEGKIDTLDPQKKYLLICQSGKRAERAHKILADRGFQHLLILDGGLAAWEQSGLPLEKGQGRALPLMRQVQVVVGLAVLIFSLLAWFVSPVFAFGAAFFGCGLTFAGATGWCGMAMLLAKMPWNKGKARASRSV